MLAEGRSDALVDLVHLELLASGDADTTGVRDLLFRHDPLLEPATADLLVARVSSRVGGLDLLDPLLSDPDITEVMVNGGGQVWIERGGRLHCTDITLSEAMAFALIERIVTPLGLRIDRTSPYVDARLPDGSRVNAIIPPLAIDGPCLTIRRFGTRQLPLSAIASAGVAQLLAWAVDARCNIVVSGGAGAGKTTLLNAMASFISDNERVITIEDAAELRLPGRHVLRLESRPSNAEGAGEVKIRDLVRNALRMRPDRIVVGEVRSGEAIDMLQAMNTGHDGSLSTCHANSPADAIRRLETLVLMGNVALPLVAVREQLRSAIDLVVHISRQADGTRKVTAVAEPMASGDPHDALVVRLLTDARGELTELPLRAYRSAVAVQPDRSWIKS